MARNFCTGMAVLLLTISTFADWPAVKDLPEIKELPDPLVMFDGTPVTTAEQWRKERRPELISLFEYYVYGKAPSPPDNFSFTVENIDPKAFGGKATRKIVTLRFGPEGTRPVTLLLVTPNHRSGPAPVFIGLNYGNHLTMTDPNIPLTWAWMNSGYAGGSDGQANDDQRGLNAPTGEKPRWYFEKAVDRGYAVATMYCGEFSPDRPDGDYAFTDGVHRGYFKEGQTRPGPHEWGTIAAWAWGLQRGADYLVKDSDIDNARIIVIGHSRLGKAALLAAALDERFALAIPSMAGCTGTSPARSDIGESVAQINKNFPHWFTDTYKRFNKQVERLPFDQHALIALVAPRPVLVTIATKDIHGNPHGQFDMLVAAAPVYELLGVKKPIATTEFPDENVLINSCLGYHIRPGVHGMTDVEWSVWLDFADKHLKR